MDRDMSQAIAFALGGKPLEFEAEVKSSLADRILDSIESKRVEVASKVFGTPEYFEANDPKPEAVETPPVENPEAE